VTISPSIHYLLWKQSSAKTIIEKDIVRWTEVIAPLRKDLPSWVNFLWLITDKTLMEFRSLFYYRIESSNNTINKSLLPFARYLLKPRDALYIESAYIGPGLVIKHGGNTVIRAASIGENCMIFQDVAIGYKYPGGGLPVIGNHVHISVGAKVLGSIRIGDYAIVAVNSVIIKDMPDRSTGGGVPARVIHQAGVTDI